MEKKTTIFVAGDADPKISRQYYEAAKVIGKQIAKKDYDLVFDGCYGLPGVVAAQNHGNLWIAYSRFQPMPNEWCNEKGARILGSYRYQSEVTRSLLENSDGAIFLKGNSGTLAELFHAIDTKKNGEHHKPIAILNIDGQWDYLEDLLQTMGLDDLYKVVDTPEQAMEYIEEQLSIPQEEHLKRFYESEAFKRKCTHDSSELEL